MTKDQQLAYMAGFLDGDGHVQISPRSQANGFQLALGVHCRHASQCGIFAEWFGGKVQRQHDYVLQSGEVRTLYCWTQGDQKAEAILRTLHPHLRLRRAHADVALRFRALVGSAGSAIEPSTLAEMQHCYDDLKAIIHEIPRRIGWVSGDEGLDLPYLAGLFDAEGYAGVVPTRRPYGTYQYFRVTVNNVVDAACLGFAAYFGGTVRFVHPAGRRGIFNWSQNGQRAGEVALSLAPFLREKSYAVQLWTDWNATHLAQVRDHGRGRSVNN